jgi:hypothetical protein
LELRTLPLIAALLFASVDHPQDLDASETSTTADSASQTQTAGDTNNSAPQDDAKPGDSLWNRFWLSGQANFIRQQHGSFYAAYNGPNSFQNAPEHATSRVLTLYTGIRLTKWFEYLLDVESAGGRGVSDALGLAGYTNLDVVRNPTLGAAPYIARNMAHYVIPLSHETTESERSPLSLFSNLPVRRLEFRAGKMSAADFFDLNSVGSDSHSQFMNWTADNNGAWDYAADTRGYTYGLYIEYDDRWGTLRFAEFLMPTVANGLTLDWNVARARGENTEYDFAAPFSRKHPITIRLLNFVNHANMGSYREAIDRDLVGETSTPDIVASRRQGRVKYGFAINEEQQVSSRFRFYGRLGWNDGRNESFAYTEVDRTRALGGDYLGTAWHRRSDKLGATFISNGISGDHRRYLALGGLGFLLGDGALSYGLEKILET